MWIGDKHYTRAELLERVGNVGQLGGTRHYTLSDGRSKGVAAVDVDTGSGLGFTILPDRGMDISLASFKGANLVYLTPNGEVHPAYYESQGLGWLRFEKCRVFRTQRAEHRPVSSQEFHLFIGHSVA